MSSWFEVGVAGLAVWNPRQPSRPQPALLPPNERRRAPETVAIALEVAQAACERAGRDPAQLPTVFASTYGDQSITDYMCATLAKAPATLSPTRFHNSVHNAAAGYWSIATGCRQSYCALGAGPFTFAAGLFAAALQVMADATDVLYVAYDIESRGPLHDSLQCCGVLGLALVLSQVGSDDATDTRLRLSVSPEGPAQPTAVAPGNPMRVCLPLLEALEQGSAVQLSLRLGPQSWLHLATSQRSH